MKPDVHDNLWPYHPIMIVIADHPENLLESFVAGTLTRDETELVLAHLETCDHCLQITEQFWEAISWRESLASAATTDEMLEEERARRIEQRVINQIHRTNIAGRALWLGTEGFVQVSFALLRPLLEKLSR